MPLIPVVPKKEKPKTVTFNLPREMVADFDLYMKLVNAPNQGYAIIGALTYVFEHDKDFLKSKEGKPLVMAAAR